MSERETALREWQVVRYGDTPEIRASLAYWRERGWPVDNPSTPWETDVRISAFKIGYRAALDAVAALPPGDAPQTCPHCKLLAVMPEVCTPEINAVIEDSIEQDWALLNKGVEIGKALAAPVDAPQTCEWRPIATCPKDGSDFVGGKYHGVYGWYWGRCAWESGRAGEDGYVRGDVPFATHWTSPPPPPVEGQTP